MTTQTATAATAKTAANPAVVGAAVMDKEAIAKAAESGAIEVGIGRIKLGDNNSRRLTSAKDDEKDIKLLADNIKKNGLFHPLVVKPVDESGKYELVAGYRRLQALKLNGAKTVPVRVVKADKPKLINLYENFKRKDISKMELALAIKDLAAENKWKLPYVDGKPQSGKSQYNVADVQKALGGVSNAFITETLKLLALPEKVQKKVHSEELASRGGFLLAKMAISNDTLEEVLAVAETLQEKKAAAKPAGKAKPVTNASADANFKHVKEARKREEAKKKSRVEAGTVAKAATKVASAKKEEAKKERKAGNVKAAEKLEQEAAAITKTVAKSGGGLRTLADWTEIVKQVKGNGDGCDNFADAYGGWLKGELEDEEMAGFMVEALDGDGGKEVKVKE